MQQLCDFYALPRSVASTYSNHCTCLAPILTRFQDIITGDEILSDSYNLKEIDGVAYEADCKKITIGNDNIGAFLKPTSASLFSKPG